MPTYDFRCPKGHEFTRFYKTISASQSEVPCPECNAIAQRQMSAGAGLLFKGSGFYLTDYGKNAHRGGEKASAKSDSSAGGGEMKADSSKAETAKPKTEGKAESPKPKAESPKKAKAE